MIVFDAWALIALLAAEPEGRKVRDLLDGEHAVSMATINFGEALDILVRRMQLPEAQVRQATDPLFRDRIQLIDISADLAWRAVQLRKKHYKKRAADLSLADCFLIAVCAPGDAVCSNDTALISAAAGEGIDAVPLS